MHGKFPVLYNRNITNKYSKNSQIPLFFKIISVLSLFLKYLAIYYFFKIRVFETRVLKSSSIKNDVDVDYFN